MRYLTQWQLARYLKVEPQSIGQRRAFVALLFLILLAPFAFAQQRVGVICTFAEQKTRIVSTMETPTDSVVAGRGVTAGRIGDLEVAVVVSPMGMVNNAISAQALVDTFEPDALVSIGMAGGLQLTPGDTFYASRVVQHDKGTIEVYGQVWSPIPSDPRVEFGWMADGIAEVLDGAEVTSGTLVSGSQFIKSAKKRDALVKKFDALAVDMQGSALAALAGQNGLPILILRTISDRADSGARASFQTFAEQGGADEVDLLLQLLQVWQFKE
ncbi:5'-methylthioadenosine/S-adenosylhomocysteine nucleosidase [bacterium]|nr:5'-methylthioadenosine/S-adenosylhomocysteine nucleosidase [bacterium]